jgi:molybdopterin-guanine dinucleotide biosynthesis protein A
MTHERPLAAAILAGGQARRLGGLDKKTLAIGGPAILERQLAVLRRVADPIFVVGAREVVPPLRLVPDAVAGAGALGGIYTAIVASPHDRTLVVACDMPFLSPVLLARMAAEDADVVIPRGERGYEPLCAIYSKACAPLMRQRIERGEFQASTLPAGLRVVELGPDVLDAYDPEGLAFVNINTPHDYARARELADRITEDN